MANITLITCTGARPQAFALCESFVKAQTIQPKYWIVVDDSEPRTACTLGQTYLRGPRAWEPSLNTHRFNMEAALAAIPSDTDIVAIFEDDDFYAPYYLQVMVRALEFSQVAGLSNARYYNLAFQGYKEMQNFQSASLAHTALRSSSLSLLKKAIDSGNFYFDIELWDRVIAEKEPFTLVANSSLGLGIKGLPGKPGLTGSHKERKDYLYDAGKVTFNVWFGVYGSLYETFLPKAVVNQGFKAPSKPLPKITPSLK